MSNYTTMPHSKVTKKSFKSAVKGKGSRPSHEKPPSQHKLSGEALLEAAIREHPELLPALSLEIEAKPIEDFPALKENPQTLAELEESVIAKGPPGQWFRKIPGLKTDICCLPAEMHSEILKHVTFLDQLSCERVCTTWRTIIRRDCAGFRYTTVDDSLSTGIKPKIRVYHDFSQFPPTSRSVEVKDKPDRPKILIHRLIQDGNFAFRNVRSEKIEPIRLFDWNKRLEWSRRPENYVDSVEMMSTHYPEDLRFPPRRYKIANLTFLNDPIAIYTSADFRVREKVPHVFIEFDAEPLRNEFKFLIGGHHGSANTCLAVPPVLPVPFPGQTSTPMMNNLTNLSMGIKETRKAFSSGVLCLRHWSLGSFLLAILGKLESDHHWYEDTSAEQNYRWNGKDYNKRWETGTDADGDWDMDNGYRRPMNISEMACYEKLLLETYQKNGYWYTRQFTKDKEKKQIHVSLNPVSAWV